MTYSGIIIELKWIFSSSGRLTLFLGFRNLNVQAFKIVFKFTSRTRRKRRQPGDNNCLHIAMQVYLVNYADMFAADTRRKVVNSM